MVQVRVVNVTRVALPPAMAGSREPVKLSFLDTFWINLPPIRRVFFYRTDRPLPSVAEQLRDSLSRTLPRFYSLAGLFTLVPDRGEVVISFSGAGDDGVELLEAEAEDGVEFQKLAEDEDHDVEGFSSLVPTLGSGELPTPVIRVQVTGFPGAGGVAVGFAVHHMAADGKAVWQFVEAWAAECRGDGSAGVEPVMDRSVIRHPGAEEIIRCFIQKHAPQLPRLLINPAIPATNLCHQSRRTFVVTAASIASLRDRVSATGAPRPSAFVALSAHIWLSFLRAKGIPPDDKMAFLRFLADCRRHLDPPVGDGYFGNCVKGCIVEATAAELLGVEGGFRAACAATRGAIDECLGDPLRDCEDWYETFKRLPMERMVSVTASPRFQVYKAADFGWGRPRRVELVSMNSGQVALVAARDEEGGVQASVALSPLHMEAFTSFFLGGLQQGA